jgi:hypothetical protein
MTRGPLVGLLSLAGPDVMGRLERGELKVEALEQLAVILADDGRFRGEDDLLDLREAAIANVRRQLLIARREAAN